MTEAEVRQHLLDVLADRPPGYILHLLSDLLLEAAEEYKPEDLVKHQKLLVATHAVLVTAHGIDALLPH